MHLDQHGSRSSRSHKSEDDSDDDSDLWDVLDEPVEVPVDAPAAQSTRKQTPPTVGASDSLSTASMGTDTDGFTSFGWMAS